MHGLHKVSQTPRTNAMIRIGAKLRQFKALELCHNIFIQEGMSLRYLAFYYHPPLAPPPPKPPPPKPPPKLLPPPPEFESGLENLPEGWYMPPSLNA